MKNKDLENKLKQLSIEDIIWIIYIGIIILSWYSNYLEREYYINNNHKAKEKYRKILIFIFTILNIVYFYFYNDSLNSIKDLNIYDSKKKKELTILSAFASLLILISGIILLYIAIKDEELAVEIAFN